ncbi:MAG: hypothetical protein KME01_14670 [Chroococcus sp. CMT-3BRIN-NPC107]|jgi:hypothetical protein|nr:hypothetical protein [Chroococcus sp. CMT-3BRIN-NPC107]
MKVYRFCLFSIFSSCLLILSSTSINAQTKTSYPPEFRENYIETCTNGRGDKRIEAMCRCTLREIEKKYTIDEFRKINRETEETGQVPPELIKLFDSCQANLNSYKSLSCRF